MSLKIKPEQRKINRNTIDKWTIYARLTDPPLFANNKKFNGDTVIAYDLENIPSTLLDRPTFYPNKDNKPIWSSLRKEQQKQHSFCYALQIKS